MKRRTSAMATVHEIYGTLLENHWLARYIADPVEFQKSFRGTIQGTLPLYTAMLRGCMPGALGLTGPALSSYFASYVQNYIQDNISIFKDTQEAQLFEQFFSLQAGLATKELSKAHFGRDFGIMPRYARRWLTMLSCTHQSTMVAAYHNTALKRINLKPKIFLSDTGLICYLQRISSPEALAMSLSRGAIFENFCFTLIKGLISSFAMPPHYYHWRTAGGAEIDLMLEYNGALYPIEMKCTSNLGGHDTRGIQALRATYPDKKIMPALVLYAGKECFWINEHAIALPWNSI
jgi:uncharacterized protein